MKDLIKRLRDQDGQAMVEYTIILALVSIAAIAMIGLVGDQVLNAFTAVRDSLVAALT